MGVSIWQRNQPVCLEGAMNVSLSRFGALWSCLKQPMGGARLARSAHTVRTPCAHNTHTCAHSAKSGELNRQQVTIATWLVLSTQKRSRS